MKLLSPIALVVLAVAPAAAEIRETLCDPVRVTVTERRIEVACADSTVLGDAGRDRQREIGRFAYPLISQSFEPQLGSQVHLVSYFLSQMQTAVTAGQPLRIWFDTESGRSEYYGCEGETCRPLVALAVERLGAP